MLDQTPDVASVYWQTTNHRSWYQESEILKSGEGGNADLIPQGVREMITVPPCTRWTVVQVQTWEHLAFIAEDEGVLRRGRGLEHFIETSITGTRSYIFGDSLESPIKNTPVPAAIFDNHNHALYFWARALSQGYIQKGATLVHIDMHSDLWTNPHRIDPNRVCDLEYMAAFTNLACNVGNYILPAQEVGLVGEMIRIEGEEQLRENLWYLKATRNDPQIPNLILNLDLDIFAPELDDISFELKQSVILGYAARAQYITIATSPFFIDQERAIEYLNRLFLSV
jgi:UPF0489 domain